MKELINTIHCIAANELNRANEKFPQFNSKHEAIGVIDEEVYEMNAELEQTNKWLKDLRVAVYRDYDLNKPISEMEKKLSATLAEGVQVLAMLKKFKCFLDKDEKQNG